MTQHDSTGTKPESLLAAAIAAVAHAGDPDRALDALVAAAVEVAGADRGAVVLWDAERSRLVVAASRGYATEALVDFETALGSADHPVATTAHSQAMAMGADPTDPASVVAAWPLRVTTDGIDFPLGAFSLTRPAARDGDPGEAPTLAAFADLAALVVDRARMAASAEERGDWQERMAHTDALTGLANARTLARVLELEVARAGRQGTDLSVALFDIDDLAATNAAGGPAAGDDILREVAATLSESVRLVDTVARWGGDEFLVVAPGSAGMTVAQRVIDALAARPAPEGRRITVSAGVARFPADGATSEQLVTAAETALRAAKASGPGELAAADAG